MGEGGWGDRDILEGGGACKLFEDFLKARLIGNHSAE